ncbi:MAG TPA: hypothetical protein VK712_01115 [Verrucomicrobiae bacterium]|jgi:hypothetical protein|nr:hypothetical protein [Verrucomicrobiae bacterium]
MSNFEFGSCPVDEYYAGEDNRIMETGLCIDGLYTMMLFLRNSRDQQAAKFPSRVNDIEQQDSGLYKLQFSILNADLAPSLDAEATLQDGFWQRSGSEALHFRSIPVRKAYFKDYYQGIYDELEAMTAAGLVESRELVAAA